jgi:hypothetical protein
MNTKGRKKKEEKNHKTHVIFRDTFVERLKDESPNDRNDRGKFD